MQVSKLHVLLVIYSRFAIICVKIDHGVYLGYISVFEIGETGVKTLERELKSYLTGLTSHTFICRLPDLFQFYLNQWKHIHVRHGFRS